MLEWRYIFQRSIDNPEIFCTPIHGESVLSDIDLSPHKGHTALRLLHDNGHFYCVLDGTRITESTHRRAWKILVTVFRETYGLSVRGDKYYHLTTMRPRTSITCMWKRGFIGDFVPAEYSTGFYYDKIRSRRCDVCSRLRRQYLLGGYSYIRFPRRTC